eukprot:TRINITY_DN65580_c0_g1_i1.p1 TRINITY_DN65580_c0_g1~~TRINITY_DN65580_c0_g1_i1.p1  ORF type:complete len:149 (+),score=17.23 TRINITY_DN65580_c0_g1_i1:211-657(+)
MPAKRAKVAPAFPDLLTEKKLDTQTQLLKAHIRRSHHPADKRGHAWKRERSEEPVSSTKSCPADPSAAAWTRLQMCDDDLLDEVAASPGAPWGGKCSGDEACSLRAFVETVQGRPLTEKPKVAREGLMNRVTKWSLQTRRRLLYALVG